MELSEDGVGFARNGKASCHVSMHVLCVYSTVHLRVCSIGSLAHASIIRVCGSGTCFSHLY